MGTVVGTLAREADALAGVGLPDLARTVTQSALLLLGADSPQWAASITRALAEVLANAEIVSFAGHGHEAVERHAA